MNFTLDHIEETRQKLIELNNMYGYSTICVPEHKNDQYYRLLLELRRREAVVIAYRRESLNYNNNLNKAVSNIKKISSLNAPLNSLIPVV